MTSIRRPVVSHVVAMTERGIIGASGKLPWHLPSDLRFFRQLTLGRPVIMGQKTFYSIGRPLPDRENIVMSRDPDFCHAGIRRAPSWPDALKMACESGSREIAVIGGGEIYDVTLPDTGRIHLVIINDGGRLDGDRFYPLIPEGWKDGSVFRNAGWTEIERRGFEASEGESYDRTYILLDRSGCGDGNE